MSYGYDKRPEMPDRFIRSGPQAMPRSAWPRKVSDAVNEGTDDQHFQILFAQACDAATLYGNSSVIQTAATAAGGSLTRTGRAWHAGIGRFGRLIEISRSVTTAGFQAERQRLDFSPFALVATDAPHCPFVLRFEDVMAMRLASAGDGSLSLQFGLAQTASTPTLAPTELFIGFFAQITGTGGDVGPYGTWNARAFDTAGTDVTTSLGITTELPHHLACEIDGGLGEIRYYIDGNHMTTVTGFTGTTSISTEVSIQWINVRGGGPNAGNGEAMYWIDNQAWVSVRVLDEAA